MSWETGDEVSLCPGTGLIIMVAVGGISLINELIKS